MNLARRRQFLVQLPWIAMLAKLIDSSVSPGCAQGKLSQRMGP
jgi:hypothetical protein